jgi:hypothetical protein
MNKAKGRKKIPALYLDRKPVLQVVADARHYVLNMTGNTYFTTPTPTLATITTGANNLEAAQKAAGNRTIGLISQRNLALKALEASLHDLANYVKVTANQSGDPDLASTILASSGMAERKFTPHKPKVFSVTQGKLSGSVVLDTKAVAGGVYIYQMSTDPNNAASWATVYTGKKVKFTKTGLTIGVRTYFRVAVIDKNVQGDFSTPLSLVVN